MSNFSITGGYCGTPKQLTFLGEKPKTLGEAWAITIEKWTLLSTWKGEGASDGGANTCGLCLYNRDEVTGLLQCPDCPIGKIGFPGCGGTPQEAHSVDATLENARAELNFLLALHGATLEE